MFVAQVMFWFTVEPVPPAEIKIEFKTNLGQNSKVEVRVIDIIEPTLLSRFWLRER